MGKNLPPQQKKKKKQVWENSSTSSSRGDGEFAVQLHSGQLKEFKDGQNRDSFKFSGFIIKSTKVSKNIY